MSCTNYTIYCVHHVHVCVWVCTCLWALVHVCMHVCVCVHVWVCIHVHVCDCRSCTCVLRGVWVCMTVYMTCVKGVYVHSIMCVYELVCTCTYVRVWLRVHDVRVKGIYLSLWACVRVCVWEREECESVCKTDQYRKVSMWVHVLLHTDMEPHCQPWTFSVHCRTRGIVDCAHALFTSVVSKNWCHQHIPMHTIEQV